MTFIQDVNKVVLPKFAITDPDRVPTGVWSSNGASVQEISIHCTNVVYARYRLTIHKHHE